MIKVMSKKLVRKTIDMIKELAAQAEEEESSEEEADADGEKKEESEEKETSANLKFQLPRAYRLHDEKWSIPYGASTTVLPLVISSGQLRSVRQL
jgi:hypothetical protein